MAWKNEEMSFRSLEIMDDLVKKYEDKVGMMKDGRDRLAKEIEDYTYDIEELKIGKQRLEDRMKEKGYL